MIGGFSLRVLAIGAHPDDVELGCGASLKALKDSGHEVYILVLTKGEASGDPKVRSAQCKMAARTLCADKVFFGKLEDTKIPDGIETITEIEKIIEALHPKLIFTHGYKDQHQDHRNASRATLSAARNINMVLYYESPAALKDFLPQVFIDVTSTLNFKLQALKIFGTQTEKVCFRGNRKSLSHDESRHYPFVANAIEGLARYRGFQSGLPLAEAFEVGKFIWTIPLGYK